MKRRFTKLMAALALLLFVAPPMTGWGQTPIYDENGGGNAPTGWLFQNNVATNDIDKTSYWLLDAGDPSDYIQTCSYDLSSYASASLSLDAATYGSGGSPIAVVEVSFDGGSSFTNLTLSGDQPTSSSYNTLSTSITSGLTNNVVIKYSNGATTGRGLRLKKLVLTAVSGGGSQLIATTTEITVPQTFNTDVYTSTTAGTLTASVTETNGGASVSGATVSWNSSNTSVATIDASGAVTLVAAGQTTITATYAGDATYEGSSDTYQLNVTSSAPAADVTFVAGTDVGTTTGNDSPDSMTKGGVTVSSTDAAFATDQYRLYQSSVTTISAPGYIISSIVFTGCDNSKPVSALSVNDNNGTYSVANNVGTWTGSSSSVSFAASAQARASKIEIWMTAHQAQQYTLTVNPLTNVEMFVYDADDQTQTLIEGGATAQTAQVFDGTQVLVSVSAATGYALATFTVDGVDHLGDIDEADSYTFTMPASDVTITATAARIYTIMFSVNGHEFADAEMTVVPGSALGTLPVPTANIPAGFVFVGWMEAPTNAYYNATTAPTMVDAATVPADDMILEAVFCISETAPGTWQLSTTAPEAGDQVVLAVNDEGTYYAFFADGNGASATEITVANNAITSTPTTVWTASDGQTTQSGTPYSGLSFARESVSGYLHFNNTGIKVAGSYNNGLFEFENIQGTSTFKMYGLLNGRYLTYDEGFGVTTDVVNACPVYVFKYIAGSSSNYDYTTLVTNHENETYIAQSNAETLYGIHYINGVVNTRNAVTNNGKLVVKSGCELDMSLQTLTNTIAANLIIEDGAQVTNAVNAFEGTVFKNIAGTDFGTPEQPTNGGYYLIASPVSQPVVPSASNGFVTENWDLYAYDAAEDDEWRNYNLANDQHAFENIEAHHGYLYASQENTTLSYAGTLNAFPSNLSLIDENDAIEIMRLVYDANSDNDLKNLTLVGNSYAETYDFYVWDEDEGDFNWGFTAYTLNDEGNGFDTDIYEMLENVAPMDAFFVLATGPNQKVVKYAQSIGNDGLNRKLNVKVSRQNGTLLDNAIVSFAAGSMAKKLYLTDNSTRVYFPISNQDYAVVRAQSEGEQPVNFKAKENGTYTLSVETKNVEMNYLHLIDNMTGADVDLLATPSYSFEAKTSDYASRFRLVFSANSVASEGACEPGFAYFNGSSWTVSNVGEATLQVVDVMGRVLSSHTLSGNAEVSINQPAGVYMLRLVSGDSVKVQKVVVR